MCTGVLYARGSLLTGNRLSKRNFGIVRKGRPRPAGRRHLNVQPAPPRAARPGIGSGRTCRHPRIRPRPTACPRQTPRARRFPVERAPPACAFDWKPTRSRNTTGTTPGRLFSGRLGAFLGSDIMKVILGSSEWCCWDSWDDPERGRVQICHKGAPRRDRPRMKPRNINDSLPAFRLDPGLCGRFGQLATPRAPWGGRSPASAVHDVGTGADTRAEGGRRPGGCPVRPRRPRPSASADPAQAPQSARSPLNPRERTSSRRSRGLPGDLGG